MPRQPLVQIRDGWPTVDIGKLIHPITIYAQAPSSPPTYDAGGITTSEAVFTTAMAAIEIMRGTDVIKGGQTTAQLFMEVTIWYQPGILPSMKVVAENGSNYVIQSIENVLEKNVVLRMNCLGLGANE